MQKKKLKETTAADTGADLAQELERLASENKALKKVLEKINPFNSSNASDSSDPSNADAEEKESQKERKSRGPKLSMVLAFSFMLLFMIGNAAEPVKRFAQKPANNTAAKATRNGPVLYDQLMPLSWGNIVSHDITDAANAAYTSFAADDFVVPEGNTWQVAYVNAAGSYNAYSGADIPAINVVFYADNGGMPGAALHTFNDVTAFNQVPVDLTMGIFLYEISLPQVVNLTPGRYWLGIQAVSDYSVTSQWGWHTHESLIIENEFHWKNPDNGFGLGFTDWTAASMFSWGSYNLAFNLCAPGLAGDVSAKAITNPVSALGLTASEQITVRIKNESESAITGINMAYRINNGTPVTENASSLSIGPNQYSTYTFNTPANLSQPGQYTITAYTNNAQDPNHANDTTETMVYNLGTVYPMVATGTQTITTCGGTFTDSGGLEGNFGMNDDAVTTLLPANPGDRVKISFLEFNVSWGAFEIYNGTGTDAPLIGNFLGTDNPGEIVAMNTDGALTIHFMGPGWEEVSGWVAFVSCVTPLADEFEMLSLTGDLSTVFEGNTLTLTATVQNTGTATADKPVTFKVNGTTLIVVNTGALAPFETANVTAQWTAPEPGNYTFDACLATDENNTNNCQLMERNVLAWNAFFEDFENEAFPPANWRHGGLWARTNASPALGQYHATSMFSNTQSDTLVTCRVDVGENPVLTFYAKTSMWWMGNLDLYYYNEATSTWNFIMNDPLNVMTYGLITADLSAFAGTTGRIGFFVSVTDPNSWSGQVDLDVITGMNITVHKDDLDLNLLAMEGDSFYTLSQPSAFSVTMNNNGLLPVTGSSYRVELMSADGTTLYSLPGNDIQPGEEQMYTLQYTFPEIQTEEVHAAVVYAEDQYQANNRSNSIFLNGIADSSEVVVVGIDETYYEAPVYFGYRNSLSESMYTGEQVAKEGVIFGIRYKFLFDGDELNVPIKLWIGQTSQADLSTWVPAGDLTLAFEGDVDFLKDAGSIYIPFQTPFHYSDTTMNLVVMVQKTSDYTANNRIFRSTGTMFTSTLLASSNSEVPDPFAPPAAGTSNINPDMDLIFNDNIGSVSGNVHDVAALPLSEVKVQVVPLNITTYTDAAGNYSLPFVPAGSYATSADKFGYQVVTHSLGTVAGQNTVLDFELPSLAMVTVSGSLTGNDDPSAGIEDAVVTLDGYAPYSTTSDASGNFVLNNVYIADNYQLRVVAGGYEIYTTTVDIQQTTQLENIVLTEAMEIARAVYAEVDSTSAMVTWFEPYTASNGVVATDDGMHENGFAGEPSEKVWLGNRMQFDEPLTVTSIDMFWAKYGVSQPGTNRLTIFDAAGHHVYTSAPFTTVDDGWVTVDVPNLNMQGKYYIMALFDVSGYQVNYLGMDTASATTPDNAFYRYEGGDFSLLSGLTLYHGSFLIHANVKFTESAGYAANNTSGNASGRSVTGYKVTMGKLDDIDNASGWAFVSDMVNTTSYTDNVTWPPADIAYYVYGVKTYYTTGESELSFSNVIPWGPVGTQKIEKPQIKVWPNPATEVLYVQAGAGATVTLLNMQGQPVMKAVADGTQYRLNVKGIGWGTYLVVVIGKNGIVSEKVIIR